jgi:tRNA pseudouridine32 synthase/23S rRNA pseudouridine746 synthase
VLGRHRKALAELGRLFKTGRVGKSYWAVVEGGPADPEGRIDLPLGRLDASRGWWMKADQKGQPAVTTWKVLGRGETPAGIADEELALKHAGCVPSRLAGKGQGGGSSRSRVTAMLPTDTSYTPPEPSPTRGEGAGRAGGGVADLLHGSAHLTWLALEPLTGRTHQLRVHCAAMGWPIVGDAIYGTAPRTGGPGLQLHSREIVVPLYKNREPIRVTAPVPAHMREWLTMCGWEETDGVPSGQ